MADMTGIEVRHAKACRTTADAAARCNCSPTYRASVTPTGSRKKIYESFPTAAAARNWRIDAKGEVRRGTLRETTSTTLREAAEAYIAGMKSGAIRDKRGEVYKASTIAGYEGALYSRGHAKMAKDTNARGQKVTRKVYARPSIIDDLGASKLSAIRRRDLQDLVERMLGAGCDGSTIRNALKPIQVIYRRAIDREEVVVNPTIGLRLPAPKGKRIRYADPVECAARLAALKDDDRALWMTAFYAGLRLGELQALDTSSIDFAAGEIVLRRSWNSKARVYGPLKNKKPGEERRVPICDALRRELLAHLGRQLASGRRGGLVFGREAETPFVGNTVHRRTLTAWRKAGLSPLGFHEARHTYASIAIASEDNIKAISEHMGHASTSITTDTYGHLMPNSSAISAAKFDAYLASATAEAASS